MVDISEDDVDLLLMDVVVVVVERGYWLGAAVFLNNCFPLPHSSNHTRWSKSLFPPSLSTTYVTKERIEYIITKGKLNKNNQDSTYCAFGD